MVTFLLFLFCLALAWKLSQLTNWSLGVESRLASDGQRLEALELRLDRMELARREPAATPVTTAAHEPVATSPVFQPGPAFEPPTPIAVPPPLPDLAPRFDPTPRIPQPDPSLYATPSSGPSHTPPPLPPFAPPVESPVEPAAPPPVFYPQPQPQESTLTRLVRQTGGWENLIGENLLNKLGALVLVIGIALFLSYSFTRMSAAGRALTGVGVSLSILASGFWLASKERYRLFSHGLTAAGWASLYFTAYAMWAIPATQVIPNPIAGVGLMLAVALGMVIHSLRFRIQSLTALSYGCIFAALALSDQSTFVAIAMLPIAGSMLWIAQCRAWFGLAWFGAAATYLTFLTRPSTGSPLLNIQAMLLLYWLTFEAFDLMRARAAASTTDEAAASPLWTRALFATNALGGVAASATLWYRMAPDSMWQFCFAAATLYLISMLLRWRISLSDERVTAATETLYEYALTISALLAGLGIFSGVPKLWTSLGYMTEAEVLFLAALFFGIRFARGLSYFGFFATLASQLDRIGEPQVSILNLSFDPWAPPLAILALLFYFNRYLTRKDVSLGGAWFSYAASALLFGLIGAETPWRFTGAAWIGLGAVLFELGVFRNALEYRLQGYAITLAGGTAAAVSLLSIPLEQRNPWVGAAAALYALATAIRAQLSLRDLSEGERQSVRIAASIGTAILGGLAAYRLTPDSYHGLGVLAVAVFLFELGMRRLPTELRYSALLLQIAGILAVVADSVFDIQKSPSRPVWIEFLAIVASAYFVTARVWNHDSLRPLRAGAAWIGSAFAMTLIWMLVPDSFVAPYYAALGLLAVELGHLFSAGDLTMLGRAIGIGSVAAFVGLTPATTSARLGGSASVAAAQWITWYRTRQSFVGAIHGWIATAVIAATVPAQWPDLTLALWAVFGATLAALARRFELSHLRWQSATLAAFAGFYGILSEVAIWQVGLVAAWWLFALALEKREADGAALRIFYSIGTALFVAAHIFDQVSGGMLTVSWAAESAALLALGFVLRERTLRLSGLALLFLCILKVFFYDLRNLETLYRILSFIGLGVILLAISWIYTRFKQQIARYL